MNDDTPIAWLALEPGTPIYSSDDQQIGKVDEVVADREKDIFSGITFKTNAMASALFIPADRIGSISKEAVQTTISAAESETLEAYES